MRVWRLVAKPFAKTAFSGEGARTAGGRWNPKGIPVVYTSGSLSLATLEMLVHVDTDLLPRNLAVIPADIPDTLKINRIDIKKLPGDWRDYPPPEKIQNIGAEWFHKKDSAVLAVPSVIIPEELNYMINPAHPDFKHITVGTPAHFFLDPRLKKSP